MKSSKVSFLPTKSSLAIVILAAAFISGCAKINDISTNLDRENFKSYFSPTTVKIYTDEKEFTGKHNADLFFSASFQNCHSR